MSFRSFVVAAALAAVVMTSHGSTAVAGAPGAQVATAGSTAEVVAAAGDRDRDRTGRQGRTRGERGDRELRRQRHRVAPGVSFTDPLRGTGGAINDKVFRAVQNTPRGGKIRIATWNFDSWGFVSVLRKAHERGVSVRLIMARTMARAQASSGPFGTLQRALARGNARRPSGMTSWARTCDHSCRGRGGAMHSKFFIFSRSGASEYVVMNSSANLTAAARKVQWNDMYTTVGRRKVYDNYYAVFREATQDRAAPYRQFRDRDIVGWFYPRVGRSNLVMNMLNQVRCRGARNAGIDGRTAIRVAQDVFNGEVGERIARKLKSLHRNGCSVRIVYSQAVGVSGDIVRSMPHNHLVQDRDGDGAYDRYLHSKAMSISGHYGGNRSQRIVLNGSANWSGLAIQSDEQGMIIDNDAVEKQYGAWINRLFNTRPASARLDPSMRTTSLDPYRFMEF